jgi:hypothetical protein
VKNLILSDVGLGQRWLTQASPELPKFLQGFQFPSDPAAIPTRLSFERAHRAARYRAFETEVTVMADDRSKRGTQDRRTVAGSESYEVDYEAEKLGISPEQLKAIIARVGTNRAKIEEAAGRIKK